MAKYEQLLEQARKRFPADQFRRSPGVCVFAEHEAEDEGDDGETIRTKYDREALEKIVNACNDRIAETGDFAVLTAGHTPSKNELAAGRKQPEVLGFVGPYRLGKIGNKNPKYAIFADEWHFADEAKRLQRLPRRSVELWMHDQPNARFFDPIAALGAETPRLDLGIRFALSPEGRRVVKYSAVAPSGANTFTKEPYQKEPEMALDESDIKKLIGAIDSLDWVQWCKSQMDAEENAADSADDEAEDFEMDDEEKDKFGEMEDDEDDPEKFGEGEDEEEMDPAKFMEAEDDDEADKPKEEIFTRRYGRPAAKALRQYRRQAADAQQRATTAERKLRRYEREHKEMLGTVEELRRESADAKRASIIDDLESEYLPNDADAFEDLRDAVLYSRGGKCSDKAFESRCNLIRKYAARRPHGHTLPRGVEPQSRRSDSNDEQLNADIIAFADRQRAAGKPITYAQAEAEVRKQRGA